VLADDNGVLFLDPVTAQNVIERALASDRAEPQLLTRLMAGEPVSSVLSIKLS
jgi:regulator of RNase E activity RraA